MFIKYTICACVCLGVCARVCACVHVCVSVLINIIAVKEVSLSWTFDILLCEYVDRARSLSVGTRQQTCDVTVVVGFWTVMWFACFCYLTDNVFTGYVEGDAVHAGIAFSFFSIPAFVSITR